MNESPIHRAEIVYIVDDDPEVLKAVSRQLRTNGWRVEPFESAEAFLENRKRQDMACLVLDVSLPGLDGIELQRQLLETREAIPIVFLTGHGENTKMKVSAANHGFLIDCLRVVHAVHRTIAASEGNRAGLTRAAKPQ